MSNPARYGAYGPGGPSRYPFQVGGYPPFYHPAARPRIPSSAKPPYETPSAWQTPGHLPHPTNVDGGPAWTGPGVPPDEFHNTPYYNPDEEAAYPPGSGHPTPWASLPREFQLDPEAGWAYGPNRPGNHNHDWYSWPAGAEQGSTRRPYNQLDHYTQSLDQRQSRLRWREEILRGDPEKAIADRAIESSTLVISFITRGPVDHPLGQGDEILFFRARRKDPTRYQYSQDLRAPWSFLAIEALPAVPIDSDEPVLSSDELSKKSIVGLIPTIDPQKDLRLVRRSKPLRWDSTTVLESFLYRIAEGKEDPDSEAYKELEVRLGHQLHYWTGLSGFQQAVESDIVSTAMIAVCLPPALSMGIDDIFADQDSRSDQLCQKALDVLYLCVQAAYARSGFRYYPIPLPPPGQPEFEICVKRRVWAYWSEVASWHLAQIRPDARVSISYSLTKALNAVRPSVDDNKVTLEDLEKYLVNAIATEADRSRNATRILIREGISEILYNQTFFPEGDALDKMHIFTSSSSSIVYNVIAKLITNVLSRKPGSPSGNNKSAATRKIMDLKITIAESRPLCEGVALALRLSHVVDSYTEYRDRTAKSNKRTSAAPSLADLGPAALDSDIQSRLRQLMIETEQARSPNKIPAQTLGLAHLLADIDAKKEKKEPKVTIELITDAAVVSTVMGACGSGVRPIILLSADRILSNGSAVNKVGSAQMAWADLPAPGKPSNAASELTASWKLTVGDQQVDELVSASHMVISNPTYEDIGIDNISGYITELGFMEVDVLSELSNIRSDLEKVVWPAA
ncbi:hypothetical protein BY996DRAFT_6415706 [Phakopsora pachyrhizi]|nr:hypothetical protein BY996DRAFT_6415706 [Phakopsora pachyrhizi]